MQKVKAVSSWNSNSYNWTLVTTKDDFIRDIGEYVSFFNSKRLHQRLEYKTPNQIEELYQADKL